MGAHPDAVGAYTAHGPEGEFALASTSHDHSHHGHSDPEKVIDDGLTRGHSGDSKQGFTSDENAMAQLIGVAILEFGVILHRYVPAFPFFFFFASPHLFMHIAHWPCISAS